jgi:hypothetical protein
MQWGISMLLFRRSPFTVLQHAFIHTGARAILALGLVSVLCAVTPLFAQACPDADLDTYADCTVSGCDDTGLTCGDCDDGDFDVNPGQTEICNQIDDDCDDLVDEGFSRPLHGLDIFAPDFSTSDHFGGAIAVVGDVNSDNVPDFAVGHPGDDNVNGNDAGSVVLLSGDDFSEICRLIDTDGAVSDQLGTSVAALGDVTGDSVPDIAAGAPLDDRTGLSSSGSVVVFSGSDCTVADRRRRRIQRPPRILRRRRSGSHRRWTAGSAGRGQK